MDTLEVVSDTADRVASRISTVKQQDADLQEMTKHQQSPLLSLALNSILIQKNLEYCQFEFIRRKMECVVFRM